MIQDGIVMGILDQALSEHLHLDPALMQQKAKIMIEQWEPLDE